MSKTIEIDVAQATLEQIIARLGPEDEVIIVRNNHPVARLIATSPQRQPRVPGLFRDAITVISEDDEHLQDFAEYMQ